MDEFEEKPKGGGTKPLQRRKLIMGNFSHLLAASLVLLAHQLDLPIKLLRRWQIRTTNGVQTGWLSYPVTRLEYWVLLIIRNYLWCNEEALRMQLAQMSAARREWVVNGSGRSWIERVVLKDVIKHKLLKKKRYLTLPIYRNILYVRYPNGQKQLTKDVFDRMKKAADYLIAKARARNNLDLLAKSVGLVIENGHYVDPNAYVPEPRTSCRGDSNLPDDVLIPITRPAAIETSLPAHEASTPATETPVAAAEETELRDFVYGAGFAGNIEHHKAELEKRLRALAEESSPHK
ncbi:hypothetical protein [Geobacter sp. AOG1]|uniref:hypothetical protein n=1 Tax=Geobacter sp. AOG1 TaxID=1566346 RepID=UPI001CC639DB|nr:hypothetical protein [Geobacter sp. AOG1]GFE56731.1 hypothetical protein AOG1_06100 [Geobacter sp. AOG1]